MNWFGQKQQKPDITLLTKNGDISGLIRSLTYDDFEIQIEAAKSLESLGPEAIGVVLKKIKTRNRNVKLGIIEALAIIKDPRAVEPLLECMGDRDAEVRWGCAIALGEIGDERAIPTLKKALGDPDKYVRYGTSFALSKIGWVPETMLEKGQLFYGMQEWGALKDMGKSAIGILKIAQKDRDTGIRFRAIELLGEIHDECVVPPLLSALSDENDTIRWKSVLVSEKAGIPLIFLPRGISKRPRIRKNPKIAALLNFLLPGQGYNYLGKWWGILLFQLDVTITLWLLRFGGDSLPYLILFPMYILIAIHAAYIAIKMPDM
ncbi:MAG: HEAT repeat domain-containing protein [Methanoregula sp.]|nr:HEAT repeat domain-containing protein [Methanoregula sp.]